MQYQTIFDASNLAYKAADFGIIALFFLLIGCFGFGYGRLTKWKKYSRKKAWFGFIFVSIICGGMLAGYYRDYRKIQSVSQTTGLRTIEGTVSNFQAHPNLIVDKSEHFCVNEVCFDYGIDTNLGFNEMHRDGSPLRDGLPVRITYVDSATITKLEVEQEH